MDSIPDKGNAHGRIWVEEFAGATDTVNAFIGKVTDAGGTIIDIKFAADSQVDSYLVIYRAKEFVRR